MASTARIPALRGLAAALAVLMALSHASAQEAPAEAGMMMTADSNSTTTTTQGNAQSVTFNTSPPLRRTEFVSVPDAIAPSFGGGNPCVVSASIATSGLGFGISAGVGLQDPECEMRQQVALLANMGLEDVAVARFCMDDNVREAFRLAGTPCPQEPAAVAGVPAAAKLAVATAPVTIRPKDECADLETVRASDLAFGEWPAACRQRHIARADR